MNLDLKKLRLNKNIPAKDMVAVVKAIHPKYDKTVQSKCENGEAYGVCLLPDAAKAVIRKFAPELQRKKDGHRLTCRISCRLEAAEHAKLLRNIRADGYATTQDWLSYTVKQYNAKKSERSKLK